jgi:hypothetical protein
MRLRPVRFVQIAGPVLALVGLAVAVTALLARSNPFRSAAETALVSVADQYDTKSLSGEELVDAVTECLSGKRGGDFIRAFEHASDAHVARYQRMSYIGLGGLVVALAGIVLFWFATATIHRRESVE